VPLDVVGQDVGAGLHVAALEGGEGLLDDGDVLIGCAVGRMAFFVGRGVGLLRWAWTRIVRPVRRRE
jgi:hypothetical protein